MIEIKVCIGSSCFLKKSPEIVSYLEQKIKNAKLENKIILSGSFCAGKCNKVGVTMFINGKLLTGVTTDSISKIWDENIEPLLK